MNKKALITTASALALVAIVGVGSTLAYFTDKDAEQNTVKFGKVDIELTEPDFPEDKEITDVLPGDTIDKNPTITVKGDSAAAYIRAKIEFSNLPESEDEDYSYEDALERSLLITVGKTEDGLKQYTQLVESEDWIKGEDGYYYYQHVVTPENGVDESRVLFDTVRIPTEWKNEFAKRSIGIDVSAEAIQAQNFDFSLVTNDDQQIVGWDIGADEIEEYVPATVDEEEEEPAPEPIG
ncbi:MAG: SipW-dependent-type signal peptide-containing protein [Lachnospiraceae bacterium]|nr:SipW-dependent-type signal peptide-containing protein [Lachnospiraceae bacterium]